MSKSKSKNRAIYHLLGTVDELNSHLGLIKAMLSGGDTQAFSCQFIEKIQKKLMMLMSHVCDCKNEKYFFSESDTAELESETGKLAERQHNLTGFVLPGKNITEAKIHIARTVARKAERMFFAASEEQPLCSNACAYINKLSDYLFVLSQQDE